MSGFNNMTSFSDLEKFVNRAEKDASARQFWCQLLAEFNVRTFCEIGVYRAKFSEFILKRCSNIETYHLIDPWRHLENWNKPANKQDDLFEAYFQEAMERLESFSEKISVIRDVSKTALERIPDKSLDAVYIDGDHTLRGITIDLIAALPKVKQGGLIGGDDFTKNIWQHGKHYSPTEVFPFALYFAEAHDLPIITLPFGQLLIFNDPEQGFQVIDHGNYTKLTPRQIYS